MNCQDVNEILDNLRFDRIESGQRQQVDAHVATCADCARRSWFPAVPVTTTSESVTSDGVSSMLKVAVCPAATRTVSPAARYPSRNAAIVRRPGRRLTRR